MEIYEKLNRIIEYLENNLESDIDYKRLEQISEMNEYNLKKTFLFLTDITIDEYVFQRRFSNVGVALYNKEDTSINLAKKYGYKNYNEFTRDFEVYNGFNILYINNKFKDLKLFTRMYLDDSFKREEIKLEYEIVKKDEIVRYVLENQMVFNRLNKDMPKIMKDLNNNELYINNKDNNDLNIIKYHDTIHRSKINYMIGFNSKVDNLKKYIIPKSRWIKIRIERDNLKDLLDIIRHFYESVLPTSKFKLKNLPDIVENNLDEGYLDYLIAIE